MVVRHTLGPVITIAATVVVVVVKSQEWRAESHPASQSITRFMLRRSITIYPSLTFTPSIPSLSPRTVKSEGDILPPALKSESSHYGESGTSLKCH